jgi:CheY-like chemotaxis protein
VVVLVEDHDGTRYVLRSALELEGFDVAEASNGLEALRLIRTISPDLVITDLEMPRLGGVGLARALRADEDHRSAVPLLLVSAHATKAHEQGMDGLFDAVLRKPVQPDELIAAAQELIETS